MTTYETREAILKLGETDPELAELIKSGATIGWPLTGLPVNSLEEAAVFLAKLPPITPPDTPTETTLEIPVGDGRTVRARVFKPSSAPKDAPLVVFYHGGGFVLGDPLHIAPQARAIAAATGAVVVAPTYRFAPEHPFPAAADDVWDTLQWLAQPANAASLGADLSAGFVLGGISAGANLAAVTAQRHVSHGAGAKLTGVALIVPYVLDESIVPAKYKDAYLSRAQNANALVIDQATMDYVARVNKFDFRSPKFSPFNDPNAHVGLPPVYFHVAGQDPLRDDGLIYERVLREHGVKTRLDVYPGVPHGHSGMMPTLSASKKAEIDLVKAAGWLLGKEVSDEDAEKAVAAAVAASVPPTASANKISCEIPVRRRFLASRKEQVVCRVETTE